MKALVEVGAVGWICVEAVRFAVAPPRAGFACGGGGGSGGSFCGGSRFGGGGGWRGRKLWIIVKEKKAGSEEAFSEKDDSF